MGAGTAAYIQKRTAIWDFIRLDHLVEPQRLGPIVFAYSLVDEVIESGGMPEHVVRSCELLFLDNCRRRTALS